MNTIQESLSVTWQSPSNIALVKYWGKRENQLPTNPSVSFSLDKAVTETTFTITPKQDAANDITLDFYFDNIPQPDFAKRLSGYLRSQTAEFPWLLTHHLEVRSRNTFPHSSGIASSASAYSALALCLCSLDESLNGSREEDFFRRASRLARLGSGSACRSVYGGYTLWGQSEFLPGSSDEYAVPLTENIHPVFADFNDTILIVEAGVKEVSSSAGHALLKNHPFAASRFETARQNTGRMLEILKSGDLQAFVSLVEGEALMLHALMMSSTPSYILMKPHTLSIIEKIRDFRNQTGIQVLFTLDAGANVHMLSPESESKRIGTFVQNELLGYCSNQAYFCNRVGKGPVKL